MVFSCLGVRFGPHWLNWQREGWLILTRRCSATAHALSNCVHARTSHFRTQSAITCTAPDRGVRMKTALSVKKYCSSAHKQNHLGKLQVLRRSTTCQTQFVFIIFKESRVTGPSHKQNHHSKLQVLRLSATLSLICIYHIQRV